MSRSAFVLGVRLPRRADAANLPASQIRKTDRPAARPQPVRRLASRLKALARVAASLGATRARSVSIQATASGPSCRSGRRPFGSPPSPAERAVFSFVIVQARGPPAACPASST